jgi:hypothetical protein
MMFKRRGKILLGVFLAASMLVFGASCSDDEEDDSGHMSEDVDYGPYDATNGSIRVKNNASKNMVCFYGQPSAGHVLGGVKPGDSTYLKKDSAIFGKESKDFMLFVVTEEDYKKYYSSEPKTLDANPYTMMYAFYNASSTNENLYSISNLLGGGCKIILQNSTQYNVELRNNGIDGEIIGYIGKDTYNKNFYIQAGSYLMFPVFKKYDKNIGEIVSTYPKFSSGKLAGQVKSESFSLDSDNPEQEFRAQDWVSDITFAPSAAYIKITNSSSSGIQFYTGATAAAYVNSLGSKNINTGKSLTFAITMDKLSGNTYSDSISTSQYSVGTERMSAADRAYLSGGANEVFKYEAGYLYTFTITGDQSNGYTVTPKTKVVDGETVIDKEVVDWSSFN